MPISSAVQDGLLTVTIVGEHLYEEVVEVVVRASADPNFSHATPVLLNARQWLGNPSSDEVWDGNRRIFSRRPDGHVGKWAILASAEPFRFGIARMIALTLESMGLSGAAFTDAEAALDYLRRP